MDKEFKPLLTLPDKNNKYFKSKKSGGYSTAILGNNSNGQRSKDFDILPNCVSWVGSRFHMLAEDPTFSLLKMCNAEDFITYANKSLEVGDSPRLGACMVWSKGKQGNSSDGCGHVAIVEKVISDTEVITSESGWSSKVLMWTQTHKKGNDGNWGLSGYKFLGFIYNPAPCCQPEINEHCHCADCDMV